MNILMAVVKAEENMHQSELGQNCWSLWGKGSQSKLHDHGLSLPVQRLAFFAFFDALTCAGSAHDYEVISGGVVMVVVYRFVVAGDQMYAVAFLCSSSGGRQITEEQS